MKIKFQLGIVAILLVFLGTYLEHTTVHNQQIVIQFSDANISSEDENTTIEIVKKQLIDIGVTNIQIGQHKDGKLKITYYSNAAIERIQNILLKGDDVFRLNYQYDHHDSNDLPNNRKLKNYELNISEIHSNTNINWDFEAVQIVEFNQKSDRYDNPEVNSSTQHINSELFNSKIKVAIKENSKINLLRDKVVYNIPEVRAGPANKGII